MQKKKGFHLHLSRQVSQSRLNTSHSSGNAFGGLDVCGPDVDDVIDDEVSDGDEDQILVMEEEDVDGQVHRYPGTLYLCFS